MASTKPSMNSSKVSFWDETEVNEQKVKDWATTGTLTENPWNIPTEGTPWKIFSPKAEHCGIWDSSPNKERHASFGDKGTTASTTCYGDLSQMTRFLGVGHSGVFTIDQYSTSEPCYVADRARDLDSLSADGYMNFSFGLIVPNELCPDWEGPAPEVKWVHWRWPRYEYDTRIPKVKACFQYMVHDGVVLQQFTVENNSDEEVPIEWLRFKSELLIRDLDFLDDFYPFNYTPDGVFELTGPLGHGHVHVQTFNEEDDEASSITQNNQSPERTSTRDTSTMQEQLPKEKPREAQDTPVASQPHAVACVITLYMNGKVVKQSEDGQPRRRMLKGKSSGSNTLEIVIAYKLLLLQEPKSNWRNFVIPARDANINNWLQKEREDLWGDAENTPLYAAGLSMISIQETSGKQSGGFEDSQNANAKSNLFTGARDALLTGQVQSGSTQESPKHHLEYFAWRHLEHILSVCAIPMPTSGLIEEEPRFTSGFSQRFEAIALTCGDMSGHRVNTPASFFAFQFLIDVACRLRKCQTKTKYMERLEERIEETCSGHIRWLQRLRKTELPKGSEEQQMRDSKKAGDGDFLQTGCFAANYWVTGESIPEDSEIWLPLNSMTDTALHILKIAEYVKLYPKGAARDVANQIRDDVYIPWLVKLDQLDKRKAFAWPHARVEGINTFRLDDHFWIWKALLFLDSSAKKVKPSSKLRNEEAMLKEAERVESEHPWLKRLYTNDGGILEAAKKFRTIAKRLAPSNVQRGILQRFTTENDVSKRRMLAVTRSARETRFLLHARDTALFYAEDCDFFLPDSFGQLWAETIEAQSYHEEYREAVWDNALRYALGIVMGTRGHTLNNDTAADLVKKCVSILIGVGGHDSFFPGELEEGGREPTIFYSEDARDFFYHAGFEINYVLLSNARKIDEIFRRVDGTQPSEPAQASSRNPSSNTDEANRRLIQSTLAEMLGGSSEQQFDRVMRTMDPGPRVLKKAWSLLMKKFLPFTNVIYASNIKSIEEEWLYNYPDFLAGSSIGIEDLESRLATAASSSETTGAIVAKKISARTDESTVFALLSSKEGCSLSFHVADYKKQKGLGRRQKKQTDPDTMRQVNSNEELFNCLGSCRTAASAKKRFIWLPNADAGTALACWGASPERAGHAISLFFDRHARYEMNLRDDTSMVSNEWQTEVHLSFYVLVDEEHEWDDGGLLLKAVKPVPRRTEKLRTGKQRTEKILQRASISFRFDGDFFDRYWTCHFIEHVPGNELKEWDFNPFLPLKEGQESPAGRSRNKYEQKPWWQRKVLELYLLNRTLGRIDSASLSILEEVRRNLGIDQNSQSPTTLDSEIDLLSMKYWQQFDNILQSIEEDLTSALFAVQKWDSREKNRGEENPRWTRTDEKKYRTTIKDLYNTTKDTTDILNYRRDHIRSLKATLTASQTRLRGDLEFHQNENVRYFTFATVIFLPLGFAASFYSMSGTPDHDAIVSLVVFSFAAFAVTVAFLLSSRKLFQAFGTVQDMGVVGVIDFFLELSARRVVRAASAMEGNKQPLQTVLDVLLGVPFTLVLGPLWLAKLLLVNILVLLQACGINVQNPQSKFSYAVQEGRRPFSPNEQRRLRRILEQSQTIRPFKSRVDIVQAVQ